MEQHPITAKATMKEDVPFLECGSSLAEREHQQQQKESNTESSTSSLVSKTTPHHATLQSLRDAIATDIVTSSNNNNNHSMTFFDSPFTTTTTTMKSTTIPYRVPLVYCDQTASNRPVQSVEDYLSRHCLPLYGNTHTNTSITGSQRYAHTHTHIMYMMKTSSMENAS